MINQNDEDPTSAVRTRRDRFPSERFRAASRSVSCLRTHRRRDKDSDVKNTISTRRSDTRVHAEDDDRYDHGRASCSARNHPRNGDGVVRHGVITASELGDVSEDGRASPDSETWSRTSRKGEQDGVRRWGVNAFRTVVAPDRRSGDRTTLALVDDVTRDRYADRTDA